MDLMTQMVYHSFRSLKMVPKRFRRDPKVEHQWCQQDPNMIPTGTQRDPTSNAEWHKDNEFRKATRGKAEGVWPPRGLATPWDGRPCYDLSLPL